MIDKLSSADVTEAGICREATPPHHPCSLCGKETKEDKFPGWRICSAPVCRAISVDAEGE